MEPAVIVHGGAWSIPDSAVPATRLGVKAAAREAYRILKDGGYATDAVQAAVVVMENDPIFDAGTGSVLNANGEIEMDSVIMDGRDLRAGAVACVQNIKNPVALARLVMDKTPHVLLVGRGANEFAEQEGVDIVPAEQLVTQSVKDELRQMRGEFTVTVHDLFNQWTASETTNLQECRPTGCDTVGAAALDCHGNVAYATSTGGITAKRPGRVGDVPIIGAGGYADNAVGSVSTTGHGESIAKVCLAHHAINLMKHGASAQSAAEESVRYMLSRVGGRGGLIVIDSKSGTIGHSCTTERMAWASASRGQLRHGVNVDEDIVEQIE